MKRTTIQVVVDDETLKKADREARREDVNRSELIRRALRFYVAARERRDLEQRHRAGYERSPIEPGEFDVFTAEQLWPED